VCVCCVCVCVFFWVMNLVLVFTSLRFGLKNVRSFFVQRCSKATNHKDAELVQKGAYIYCAYHQQSLCKKQGH
jgi:hypothetical protein